MLMRRWPRGCLPYVSVSVRAAPTVALAPTQIRPFLKKTPPHPGVQSASRPPSPPLSSPPSSTSSLRRRRRPHPRCHRRRPPPLWTTTPPLAHLATPIRSHHGSATPKSCSANPHRRLNRRRRRPRSPAAYPAPPSNHRADIHPLASPFGVDIAISHRITAPTGHRALLPWRLGHPLEQLGRREGAPAAIAAGGGATPRSTVRAVGSGCPHLVHVYSRCLSYASKPAPSLMGAAPATVFCAYSAFARRAYSA
jgi:hypothetical protein